ncbi:MAG: hypothetical protein K2L88_05745 [Clostridiales bacterium]|nr:hypothetical protein [Clostridiales bacterium]
MVNNIPECLELVTDPKITKLFRSDDIVQSLQQSFSFMPQNKAVKPLRPTPIEEMGLIARYNRKKSEKVFADDGSVNPQPRCSWGATHLARFINRYVSWYKKKPSADRTKFLEMFEQTAKENNVILPKLSEINNRNRTPKKRLVAEAIDINRYSDVTKLKLYYDGENFVGYVPGENKAVTRETYERTKWDDLFDSLYSVLKSQPENAEYDKTSEEKEEIRQSLEYELVRQFYDVYGYDDKSENEPCPLFISRKLWNMTAAYHERKKRFFRKKDQVRWTAWITITYSDEKFKSEEDFMRTLKTFFKNKAHADRGNWLVMGQFEHGEERGRLHFHGFFYIPQGTVSRELVNRSKFSDKEQKWHNYKADTELLEKFGDNEYEDITDATQKDIHAMAKYTDKMTRYMDKGGKVFYSRHIPMDFELDVLGQDIFTKFTIVHKRQVVRYVMWNDAFVRSDVQITRKTSIAEQEAYDIGLLGEERSVA